MVKLKQIKKSLLKEQRALVGDSFFPRVLLREQRAPVEDFFSANALLREQRAPVEDFFSANALLREQRAQAEAVFRLMIDSVVGLAILLVILSALNYFQNQVIIQSKSDLISLVDNAVNTPTGIVLKSGELTFNKDFIVDPFLFESAVNLSHHCFEFRSKGGSVKLSSDQRKIEFDQRLNLIVYAQCFNNSNCDPYIHPTDYGSCCTQCIVSFGLPLENN